MVLASLIARGERNGDYSNVAERQALVSASDLLYPLSSLLPLALTLAPSRHGGHPSASLKPTAQDQPIQPGLCSGPHPELSSPSARAAPCSPPRASRMGSFRPTGRLVSRPRPSKTGPCRVRAEGAS